MGGAYDTDVHFYVKDGINSVLPYVPLQWRRTFEMRGTKLGGDTPVPQRFEFPTGSRLRVDAFTPDGGLPGTDADFARGDLLDRFDLAGSVLSSLEAGQMAQGFAGTEASSVLCSAFNDYALEHWYDVDHRFRIAICVPSVHPEAAAAEVRRLSEHPGVAAIYVPLLHTPLGSRHFYPIYEAAQERGLPIFLHITAAEFNYQGTRGPTPTGWLENFSERRVAYTLLGPVALSSLIFSGTLDRFPRLNFAFIEFGFAWAVPLMWRMDSTLALRPRRHPLAEDAAQPLPARAHQIRHPASRRPRQPGRNGPADRHARSGDPDVQHRLPALGRRYARAGLPDAAQLRQRAHFPRQRQQHVPLLKAASIAIERPISRTLGRVAA